MHAEPIDGLLLELLNEAPGPWHVEELEEQFGRGLLVRDALSRLAVAGMIHRLERHHFVFTSAAGRYAHAMSKAKP